MAQPIIYQVPPISSCSAEVQGCNNRTCDGPYLRVQPDMARASWTDHYSFHWSLPSLRSNRLIISSIEGSQKCKSVHITRQEKPFWCQDSCQHCDWLWQFLLFWMHQIARAQCNSPQTQPWNPRIGSWTVDPPEASSSTQEIHSISQLHRHYTDTASPESGCPGRTNVSWIAFRATGGNSSLIARMERPSLSERFKTKF